MNVNTAVVTPGFDNRGCAGWGAGTFLGIDRADGEVYRWQWDFYNQHKNLIDIVFIASWSDFTEGHEIEPTVKNGYRELETTQEYAAMFRGKEVEDNAKEALQIPQKIFKSKKYTEKLEKTGFDVEEMKGLLNAAALGTSKGAYRFAQAMIEKADELQQECEENLEIETITVSSAQGNLQIVSYDAEEIQAKGVEVANGKPVSTNDDVAEGRAKNAVDGMITDNSSWITSQNQSGYWLEIDLQAEYALIGADLYTGKMDGTYGLRDVKLQAYQNENWVDIPGASVTGNDENNTNLFWSFDESVTTSKVRIVCNDGETGVRLREIKVYADPDMANWNAASQQTVIKGRNIAKGKSVTTNDATSSGPVSNLVDGVISDDSRWISSQNGSTYWAEIDFGAEYEIVAADLYTGKDDGTWALETVRLEYLKGGEWITIPETETTGNGRTNTDLMWTFTPVTTSKVRLVSEDGARGVRVRELMIYTQGDPSQVEDESFLAVRGREVAQGKPVTTNSELQNGKAEMAVDGILTDGSMWMTSTDKDTYILEVDLQEKCAVMGADVYSGMNNGTWAVENVRVQYNNNGEWTDVPGGRITNNPKSKTQLRWNFTQSVETDKIRFCFDDGTRGVKLREVRLYAEQVTVESSKTEVYDMSLGIYLRMDEELAKELRGSYFDAMLYMQYLGDTDQSFIVTADCKRPLPEKIGTTQGDYSVIANVRQEMTYDWEQCCIEMYKENLALEHSLSNDADFVISGTGNVRNIEMVFQVYKKKG